MTVTGQGGAAEASEQLSLGSAAGRWVLATTVLGSALGFMDATTVNVALPVLGRDLGADVADLQWVVSGYALSLGALLLLGGSLGDRYGRRRVFVIGAAWFTVASVLCGLAPTSATLIWARVLQGVGAALMTPGSLAIIQSGFHADERARAIGAWSALSGVGAAFGPMFGGYLVDAVSWRAVFLLNIPLGIGIVWAALRHLPESRDPTAGARLDVAGSALITIALAGGSFALIQAPSGHTSRVVIVVATLMGIGGLACFVLVERRQEHPMLPAGIFNGLFVSANAITFAVYAVLGGVIFLLVIHLEATLRYSPLQAGAATLPITVLMLGLSSRSGALANRIGPRLQLTVGPLLLAVGMLMMAPIATGDRYATAVLPGLVVFGLGLTSIVAPVTATALAAVDDRHAGVASGTNTAVARIAGLVAVAVLPAVAGLSGADYDSAAALHAGFPIAMRVAAAVAACGAVVALLTIRRDALEPDGARP
ncbi:MAG: DHA2 family efflux MFS transporter permease subunit [Thermoleophilia bacterium]